MEKQIRGDDKEIAELEATLDAEFSSSEAELKVFHFTSIAQVEKSRTERSEIDALAKSFQSEFSLEQSKCDGVVGPHVNPHEMFGDLDKLLLQLDAQAVELRDVIERQKTSLRQEWDAKLEAENGRHSVQVTRSSMGTERERTRLALLQEVGDTTQAQNEAEQHLNDDINRIQEGHAKHVEVIMAKLAQVQSQEEINALRHSLSELALSRATKAADMKDSAVNMENEMKQLTAAERDVHRRRILETDNRMRSNGLEHDTTRTQLQRQIIDSKAKFDQGRTDIAADGQRDCNEVSEMHRVRISSLLTDFQNLRDQLERTGIAFQKKLKDNCSQYQSSIDENIRTFRSEAEKRDRDWVEMRAFFEEKLGVLTKKRDDAMLLFQQRPSRQSEIDVIEQLNAALQTKTMQLSNALKDYQEYKGLLVQAEKAGHARFGKGPKIGVLEPLGQKVPAH
jgi:hypothetical protein